MYVVYLLLWSSYAVINGDDSILEKDDDEPEIDEVKPDALKAGSEDNVVLSTQDDDLDDIKKKLGKYFESTEIKIFSSNTKKLMEELFQAHEKKEKKQFEIDALKVKIGILKEKHKNKIEELELQIGDLLKKMAEDDSKPNIEESQSKEKTDDAA
jgi:hypothetical protein